MRQRKRGVQLRWKIVGPYAVLAILLALFGAALVTRLVAGSLDDRFTNQLVEASHVAADAMVRQERRHLAVVRAIAFTEGMPEALAARSPAGIQAGALPIAANAAVEYLEVLDAAGTRLFGVRLQGEQYEVLVAPASRAGWAMVRDLLGAGVESGGDKVAAIVDVGDEGGVFYSGGSIRDAGGQTVGVVLVGTSLHSLVRTLKSEALADVSIRDTGGRLLASTFVLSDPDAADELRRGPGDPPLVAGLSERHALFGRDYQILYNELDIRQQTVGWYSVAMPRTFITSFASTARLQMMLFFTLATLAVLVIGWLLARALTRPLGRLLQAANAVSGGDLSARSGVLGGDEIGVLAGAFDQMAERLERNHVNTLGALVSAIDARDGYTRGHSVRVGHLAAEIGRALSLTSNELQRLQMAGMLHDIGKIGIRDSVLLKPGQLTDDERKSIQEHPAIGLQILERVELPPDVLAAIGGHHERLNGSGYPLALADDHVSLFMRVLAIADVYDALITDRPYRAALELTEVLAILQKEVDIGLLDGDVLARLRKIAAAWETRRRTDSTLDGFSLEVKSANAIPLFRPKVA